MTGRPGPDRIRAEILAQARARGPGRTLCPSEVARALAADWRSLMPDVRAEAGHLAAEGALAVTQKGRAVDVACARGPVRLGLPSPD
ncbi:MAG: DUF3253 domain-containing protein [Paracoccaceae bacterium]